jgi:ELP3 family radical SAM enzyme/protein acetyltransferase
MTSDIEDIMSRETYNDIKEFIKNNEKDILDWRKMSLKFQRQFHYPLSKNMLRRVYCNETKLQPPRELIKKACRSQYGILNVCVFTAAYPTYTNEHGEKVSQMFSCKHNCYYCPNEPNQPRSYLMKEPGVARANECDFDCVRQFHTRLKQYEAMGHPLDKIEFEISGGTWSEYPKEYQYEFVRDGYYAANVFNEEQRERKSLEEEISLNENAKIHIIGLTIETRPDQINLEEIKQLRIFNVTRVQIGVQHTEDRILKKINRGHTIQQSKDAIKLLLNNCLKVDIHLMPMLPGSTPDMDKDMFDTVLHDPNLQVDQWKVYPTSVVPWSVLETWYNSGKFKPYSEESLFDVLVYMKQQVHNRIRLIRIVRDINDEYIMGGCKKTHMRQLLQTHMNKYNWICKCIRCRSVKNHEIDPNYKLKIDRFDASDGVEYFISYVSEDELVLYGFCRLRLVKNTEDQLTELKNCALVRELHVYSSLTPVNSRIKNIQHKGFGKKLLKKAEHIAKYNGYHKIAVISGVGVRNYYRKQGYKLHDTYMVKNLYSSYAITGICMLCIFIVLVNIGKKWI